MAFDPNQYKLTTREQWQNAAGAWNEWGGLLREWLGAPTEIMLDMAKIGAGARVLDVAAGAGDQTLMAAERVGKSGFVLATDISPKILEFALSNARAHGFDNVRVSEQDGENLDVPAETFDAVISRVGLIYFPNQQRALASMRRALKPGGAIAAIVYSVPDKNQFFSIPVSIIRERAKLPPPVPGQPGPFSLGAPGAIAGEFTKAGLKNIEVRHVPSPVRVKSAAECVRFEKESFGALHQMMAKLSEPEKAEVWRDIELKLKQFEGPRGFEGPCEMLVAVGFK